MTAVLTFDSLQNDVIEWLERNIGGRNDETFRNQLPALINNAERRIATELKIQGFLVAVTSFTVPGKSVYAKPDSWRETVSLNIGGGPNKSRREPIMARSYEYVRACWPDESETGFPEMYADYNAAHWLLAPTPDEAYPYEVLYYEQLPLLSLSNQTNWATENLPRLVLLATLLEAAKFLRDPSEAARQADYDREAAMVNGEDLSKIFDRMAVRKKA